MLIKIAFRNIVRHKLRSMIALAALVIGCLAIIFTTGFFEHLFFSAQESFIYTQTGHLQISSKNRPIDEHEIERMPAVKKVVPKINFSALLTDGEKSIPIHIQSYVPGKDNIIDLKPIKSRIERLKLILRGFVLEQGEDIVDPMGQEMMVGALMPKRFPIEVGSDLIILNKTESGAVNGMDIKVRGIFRSGIKEIDEFTALVPYEQAKGLMRMDDPQYLTLYLDKTNQTMETKKHLTQWAKKNNLDIEIKTWFELNDFAFRVRGLFGRWVNIVFLLTGLIFFLSIYNIMTISVSERTVEIGTLRSLGTTSKGILQLVLLEGLLIGLMGGLLGVAVGALVTKVIAIIGITMPPTPGASSEWASQPFVVWSSCLISFSIAVISSVVSAFLPARRAAHLEIAQALRFSN